jgi:putative glycosyltransferase (TIGR04348 family)
MNRPEICLITPALATSNNGNWQTASRWARWLRRDYRVSVAQTWDRRPADLMIGLHARRSADSIASWAGLVPPRPLIVVLTGTDLYRDIQVDAQARSSLELAHRLVVLNQLGARAVPERLRDKVSVCLQSAAARRALPKSERRLRAVMVGHLRAEKAPETFMAAARRLAHRADLAFDHIGAALDPALGARAEALAREQPRYRWLGALPHATTRAHIQRAHVLVHASRMEGGAHVVIEAVTSGTPVLASRIDGNVGLLGEGYGGYFEAGDEAALVTLLERCRDDPAMLARLRRECRARAELFDPARERATLLGLVATTLETHR